MLEFLIGFLIALTSGNVYVSEGSAISSDNQQAVYSQVAFEWDCDDETCFIVIDNAGVHTGP